MWIDSQNRLQVGKGGCPIAGRYVNESPVVIDEYRVRAVVERAAEIFEGVTVALSRAVKHAAVQRRQGQSGIESQRVIVIDQSEISLAERFISQAPVVEAP